MASGRLALRFCVLHSPCTIALHAADCSKDGQLLFGTTSKGTWTTTFPPGTYFYKWVGCSRLPGYRNCVDVSGGRGGCCMAMPRVYCRGEGTRLLSMGGALWCVVYGTTPLRPLSRACRHVHSHGPTHILHYLLGPGTSRCSGAVCKGASLLAFQRTSAAASACLLYLPRS